MYLFVQIFLKWQCLQAEQGAEQQWGRGVAVGRSHLFALWSSPGTLLAETASTQPAGQRAGLLSCVHQGPWLRSGGGVLCPSSAPGSGWAQRVLPASLWKTFSQKHFEKGSLLEC